MSAIWLDEHAQQRIVHLGSGSGSLLTCVLAESPIDFLRLLAIGYDEICWNEAFSETPNASSTGLLVHPNLEFQRWAKQPFSVTIPQTATEIVLHPSEMGHAESEDRFCRW